MLSLLIHILARRCRDLKISRASLESLVRPLKELHDLQLRIFRRQGHHPQCKLSDRPTQGMIISKTTESLSQKLDKFARLSSVYIHKLHSEAKELQAKELKALSSSSFKIDERLISRKSSLLYKQKTHPRLQHWIP